MVTSATIEDERWMELYQQRAALERQQQVQKVSIKREKMSFGSKLSAHKVLIVGALIFDLVGLIPYLGVLTNFIFMAMVWIYFMLKPNIKGSPMKGLAGSMAAGSIADLILFGIVPANLIMVLNKLRVTKQYKKIGD